MARQGEARAQASSASASATKTRRSHRKSRNGCIECKRRHIRCDEGRPACTNCTIAERACSFPLSRSTLDVPPNQAQAYGGQLHSQSCSQAGPAGLSPGGSSSSPGSKAYQDEPPKTIPQSLPSFNESFADATPPPVTSSSSSTTTTASMGSTFTPQHLILLHHLETAMDSDILGCGQTATVVDMAIRHIAECPYLIDQLLAFSAMHLAQQRPEHATTLRHQATELQTRGLAYFAKETERLGTGDVNYPGPRFLFSTLLSLHMLAETLTYHRSDFHLFINRFIECIHIHRGILTVVRPVLKLLMQTELEPILAVSQIQLPRDPRRGTECEPLNALIDASDLPPAGATACREAARMLQWAFDLSSRLPSPDIPHAVSGFSIMVPPEYVDVLRGHRPEALIILAYYGVLVHRTRRYWICGGNGAFMIRAIAQHLGVYWQGAMRWPLEVLENEKD